MFKLGSNQIVLLSCLILLVGTGTYLTYYRQENTLSRLEQEIEAKQKEQERIRTLQVNLSEAQSRLKTVRREWNSRYKIVPERVSSPAIVGYLTDLTQSGFKRFDVMSSGVEDRDGYKVHTFSAEGQAFFTSLYRFVWTVENNRPFYRIRNLNLSYLEDRGENEETGQPSLDVLVSFEMDVEAIYGAVGDIGEPQGASEGGELEGLPVAQTSPSPPLPSSVLPNPALGINPFYPLVFEQIPPNEFGRLDVEASRLVSIVAGEAVFVSGDEIDRVGEGDRVYLGRITEVDATEGRVVARLNKGGVVETVEVTLESEGQPDEDSGGS